MRIPAFFWTLQRPVVDRARGVVARLRGIPPLGGAGGPLLREVSLLPLAFVAEHPLVQPDRTSCGSSTLVLLRMLRDPTFAAVVLEATDPDPVFATAALGVRRRTNAGRDARGSLQLPWPAALGVRPAAMVRLLEAPEGFGAARTSYRTVVIDPADPAPVFDAVVASVEAGEPVPLYIGDGHWMQHIVLVVGASSESLSVYDPAVGHEVPIDRGAFLRGEMRVAGWARPWLAILGETG